MIKTKSDAGYTLRYYGKFNKIGFLTLLQKECKRYLAVAIQTVAAPVLTSWLFLMIFILALGRGVQTIEGVPFAIFLLPGIVIMSVTQNAFANTSSSIMIAKFNGNISDVLMPPLTEHEFISAYFLAAASRGLAVGLLTWLGALYFIPVYPVYPWLALLTALLACLFLASLGLLAGLWAQKFDQLALVTNFLVTPLTFLSGTFYSIARLPEVVLPFVYFNPFFYMIDLFRYSFIGHSDSSSALALTVLLVCNVFLYFTSYKLFKHGYRIKT